MKKFLKIVVLGLLLSGKATSHDTYLITIKCVGNDPFEPESLFPTIYTINFESKEAKLQDSKKDKSIKKILRYSENEIIIDESYDRISLTRKINRSTGKFEITRIDNNVIKEDRKKEYRTGICEKIGKAF